MVWISAAPGPNKKNNPDGIPMDRPGGLSMPKNESFASFLKGAKT
jgi:hypothetical protein